MPFCLSSSAFLIKRVVYGRQREDDNQLVFFAHNLVTVSFAWKMTAGYPCFVGPASPESRILEYSLGLTLLGEYSCMLRQVSTLSSDEIQGGGEMKFKLLQFLRLIRAGWIVQGLAA